MLFLSDSDSLLDPAEDDKLFLRYRFTTGLLGLGDLELINKKRNKEEAQCLNSHLSIRAFTLTSGQNGAYLHVKRTSME